MSRNINKDERKNCLNCLKIVRTLLCLMIELQPQLGKNIFLKSFKILMKNVSQ